MHRQYSDSLASVASNNASSQKVLLPVRMGRPPIQLTHNVCTPRRAPPELNVCTAGTRPHARTRRLHNACNVVGLVIISAPYQPVRLGAAADSARPFRSFRPFTFHQVCIPQRKIVKKMLESNLHTAPSFHIILPVAF